MRRLPNVCRLSWSMIEDWTVSRPTSKITLPLPHRYPPPLLYQATQETVGMITSQVLAPLPIPSSVHKSSSPMALPKLFTWGKFNGFPAPSHTSPRGRGALCRIYPPSDGPPRFPTGPTQLYSSRTNRRWRPKWATPGTINNTISTSR